MKKTSARGAKAVNLRTAQRLAQLAGWLMVSLGVSAAVMTLMALELGSVLISEAGVIAIPTHMAWVGILGAALALVGAIGTTFWLGRIEAEKGVRRIATMVAVAGIASICLWPVFISPMGWVMVPILLTAAAMGMAGGAEGLTKKK